MRFGGRCVFRPPTLVSVADNGSHCISLACQIQCFLARTGVQQERVAMYSVYHVHRFRATRFSPGRCIHFGGKRSGHELSAVVPAQAGIQGCGDRMDPRLRGGDGHACSGAEILHRIRYSTFARPGGGSGPRCQSRAQPGPYRAAAWREEKSQDKEPRADQDHRRPRGHVDIEG